MEKEHNRVAGGIFIYKQKSRRRRREYKYFVLDRVNGEEFRIESVFSYFKKTDAEKGMEKHLALFEKYKKKGFFS